VSDRLTARRFSLAGLSLWLILIAAVIVSLRSPIPVIWGDTPPFLESALRTLETGRPTVVGGRDPGYPAILALTFALNGDLRTVVVLQEAACTASILALAAAAQFLAGSPFALLPVIILAMYPGLLMFRNVITAEMFYLVFLTLAMLGLLLAMSAKEAPRFWLTGAAVFFAALATCCKSQGLFVLVAVIALGLWIAWPYTLRRIAPIMFSCAVALALILTLSRVGVSPSDRASVVFVAKTFFCNHLNIVFASEAARRELAAAADDGADAFTARLAADFASKRNRWPTLGFFGDECFYDAGLDQYLANSGEHPSNPQSYDIAAGYWRIFLAAIRDRPLLYIGKIVHQMAYGASIAWPPYGLEPTIPVSTDDVVHVAEIMSRHGLPALPIADRPVRGWILGNLGWVSTGLFRGLSAAFLAAGVLWIIAAASGRYPAFSTRGGMLIVLWLASILTTAVAHTLDIWRYLVPSTPMVALMLSLSGVEFAKAIGVHRRQLPGP
jgi:Dolichyl-phosphate-mannose-protein mannosyltransferase